MSDPNNDYEPDPTTAALLAALDIYDGPADVEPTMAGLYAALSQLVESHPEAAGEPGWVLSLDNTPPLDGYVPQPTIVTVAVGDTTRIDIAHPVEEDDPLPLTVPLTVEVIEQLVPVLLDLVDNHRLALLQEERECVHCGGDGLARPLWSQAC
ncbi:hypothetical protein ACIQXD_36825 [Streptomyces uncialis]|uniref:hypothetical protein n=1 Tax=Streptomyces uncialis TaxID=1048205 RepID=UPI00381822FA